MYLEKINGPEDVKKIADEILILENTKISKKELQVLV